MKKIFFLFWVAILFFSLNTRAEATLPTISDGLTEVWYFIQFRAGSAVLEDKGEDVNIMTANPEIDITNHLDIDQLNPDQLWKVTGSLTAATLVSKSGNTIYYDGSRYKAAASTNTPVEFEIIASENTKYSGSLDLKDGEQGMNQSGGTGAGKELGKWTVGSDGNVLQFVLPADFFVNYPELTPEGTSDADSKWYYIRSARGGGMYTDVGTDKKLDTYPPIEGIEDNQLWKFEGTSYSDFKVINKAGKGITYNTTSDAYLISTETDKIKWNLQKSGYDYVGYDNARVFALYNETNSGNLDKSNWNYGYGRWTELSEGTSLVFLTPEEVTKIENPISTDEFNEKWYTIQFDEDADYSIQDMAVGEFAAIETTDATKPEQLWKFTGSLDSLKIVNYENTALTSKEGDATKRLTTAESAESANDFKLETYKWNNNSNWRIRNITLQKADAALREACIALKSATSPNIVMDYVRNDPAAITITEVTTLPKYFGVDKTALDYAPIEIGQTSEPQTIMVKGRSLTENISSALETGWDEIFVITKAEGWDDQKGGYLSIVFTPKAGGSQSAKLTITDGETSKEVILTGYGATDPTIITEDAVSFGNVTENKKSVQSIEVSGISLKGDITYAIEGANPSDFSYELGEDWTAAEGGTFIITALPTAVGDITANLIFSTQDGEDKTVTLTATGVALDLPVELSLADGSADVWYYIFSERGNTYVQDMGEGQAINTQVTNGSDEQLWKFVETDYSNKYLVVNKSGRSLAYTTTAIENGSPANCFYTGGSANFTYDIVTFKNEGFWQIRCNEIGETGSFINKSNSDLTFGSYGVNNDDGNSFKFTPASEITSYEFPKISTEANEYWYYIVFNNKQNLAIQENGLDNALQAQTKNEVTGENQLWKIIGTEDNYQFVSKANPTAYLLMKDGAFKNNETDQTGFVLTTSGETGTLFKIITTMKGYLAATPEGSSYGLNPFGGVNAGNYIGLWSTTDANTQLRFFEYADASLTDLTVSEGTLSPAFETGVYSYSVSVENTVTSIDIAATAKEANTTITGIGSHDLQAGDNSLVVTAVNNSNTIEYTVIVTRAASTDATLKSLTLSMGTLTPEFSAEVTRYTATVSSQEATITIEAEANHEGATVLGTGEKDLVLGSNTFLVTVTAEDGTTVKRYIIEITNTGSGINNLEEDNILISSDNGVLTATFEGSKEIQVLTTTGLFIDKATAVTSYSKPLTQGIYLLVIDNITYKVLVK